MKYIISSLFTVSLLLMITPSNGYACVCFQRQPPCVDYWEADAVFIGSVTQVSPGYEDYEASGRIGKRTILISVEQAYRGISGATTKLESRISDCEYTFVVGKKYFIYAYRNKATDVLGTGGCSRTRELSRATEDLEFVKRLAQGRVDLEILGIATKNGYDKMKDLAILVRGAGKEYKTTTDQEGRFRIVVEAPGLYTVRIVLASNYTIAGDSYQLGRRTRGVVKNGRFTFESDVEVGSGKCAFLDIPVYGPRE